MRIADRVRMLMADNAESIFGFGQRMSNLGPVQANADQFVERFWGKVNEDGPTPGHIPAIGPCWVWTGCKNYFGYGWVHIRRPGFNMVKAHRVAWQISFGDIPTNMLVLHKCDNPTCVNPEHLYLGTSLDNAQDRENKGRHGRNELPKSRHTKSDSGATQGGERTGKNAELRESSRCRAVAPTPDRRRLNEGSGRAAVLVAQRPQED